MLATVKQIYLYPVKSMRGVSVSEAHLGLNGFIGDRRYAFVRGEHAGRDGFPWMTGREKPRMILYAPSFDEMPTPHNDPRVVVRTPEGEEFEVHDPRLCERISHEYGHPVFLFKSKRGNFDSQHVSIFSHASLRDLEIESGSAIDYRQFRANLYIEPNDGNPFDEEEWVGRILQIGEFATIGVTKKDSRCMMINLNPETAKQDPAVLRTVTRLHNEEAGIYGNVVAPGLVRVGDEIRLV
ncbi:MAG TPA: MOSC N-terminal beta barrel domain-containing protein [Anaerolineae bacterium]|nr:MOSC N-terminal beta barrel domain-containing protein [Anaerolineae bacterium]